MDSRTGEREDLGGVDGKNQDPKRGDWGVREY